MHKTGYLNFKHRGLFRIKALDVSKGESDNK